MPVFAGIYGEDCGVRGLGQAITNIGASAPMPTKPTKPIWLTKSNLMNQSLKSSTSNMQSFSIGCSLDGWKLLTTKKKEASLPANPLMLDTKVTKNFGCLLVAQLKNNWDFLVVKSCIQLFATRKHLLYFFQLCPSLFCRSSGLRPGQTDLICECGRGQSQVFKHFL